MRSRINLTFVFLVLCALVVVRSWTDAEDEALRQEALSKLPKPLENMKIKELKKLLDERGRSPYSDPEKYCNFQVHQIFA
jgi:hypothetical protein